MINERPTKRLADKAYGRNMKRQKLYETVSKCIFVPSPECAKAKVKGTGAITGRVALPAHRGRMRKMYDKLGPAMKKPDKTLGRYLLVPME